MTAFAFAFGYLLIPFLVVYLAGRTRLSSSHLGLSYLLAWLFLSPVILVFGEPQQGSIVNIVALAWLFLSPVILVFGGPQQGSITNIVALGGAAIAATLSLPVFRSRAKLPDGP